MIRVSAYWGGWKKRHSSDLALFFNLQTPDGFHRWGLLHAAIQLIQIDGSVREAFSRLASAAVRCIACGIPVPSALPATDSQP